MQSLLQRQEAWCDAIMYEMPAAVAALVLKAQRDPSVDSMHVICLRWLPL